jgi:organic radical activating enzyme
LDGFIGEESQAKGKTMFRIDTDTRKYASLVVTHECNRHCPFCIDAYRGNAEYISIPLVKKACEVFHERGIVDVLIVGGEPTIHPDIVNICKAIRAEGFNTILTTNFSNPQAFYQLDGIVDCFNVSWYGQKEIPHQHNVLSDLTISALIHKEQLRTKLGLDTFIDAYGQGAHLKFSTLAICNDFTRENQNVEYLDRLDCEKVILFDEIEGQIYRDCIIKRYDRVVNHNAHQSLKFHVDGEVSNSWVRKGKA